MRIAFADIGPEDLDVLEEMLYEAIFVPPGEARPPRRILGLPEIARYAAGWGRPGDFGLIARSGEEALGAAWFRLFGGDDRGFGYIDERTPELSMAVRPDVRGLGIGSALLEELITAARDRGFETLSLSVDVRNPARHLYERLGFEVAGEADQALTMVKALRTAAPDGAGRTSLEESVALAMDGSDGRVVPYLPYILQDAWELGTDPRVVVDLVRRRAHVHFRPRVLDLGCGKGAVSVRLAAALGCRCLSIDGIREFVEYAEAKAEEEGVTQLCRFEVADVRERIATLGRFDIIVLGAIGPVFGDYRTTLENLDPHLASGGLVIVDDGFLPDDSSRVHPQVLKREVLLEQITAAGMRLAEVIPVGVDEMKAVNEAVFRDLKRRCAELALKYPEHKGIFEAYVRRQTEENAFLENEIVCAVLAIERTADGAEPRGSGGC